MAMGAGGGGGAVVSWDLERKSEVPVEKGNYGYKSLRTTYKSRDLGEAPSV